MPPSPACARALERVVSALRAEGHEIIDAHPPSSYEGLVLASQLIHADGGHTFGSFLRYGEKLDAGVSQMAWYMRLPGPIRYLYYLWVRYVRRDDLWAGLIRGFHRKTTAELWRLVARREVYRAQWHAWWHDGGDGDTPLDFLLTVPNAMPAIPHHGMKQAFASCGYTFLFNLLDYTAGVLPVTTVDRSQDRLPPTFFLDGAARNAVARGAYVHYNADAMHGLPVGVQVVGRRLEEEKVLGFMQRIEDALKKGGGD